MNNATKLKKIHIVTECYYREQFHYYGYKTLPLFQRTPLEEFEEHGVKNKRLNSSCFSEPHMLRISIWRLTPSIKILR